jgi:hypothetical protein
MDPADTTPEERETAADMHVSVEKLREVRAVARDWAAHRPLWMRALGAIRGWL